MTNTLQYQGYYAIPQQTLTDTIFTSFLQYVDRSEKTIKTYTTNIKQFMAWLHYEAITQPVREDIINYRDWLLREHTQIQLSDNEKGYSIVYLKTGEASIISLKANTVKQYLQSVKQFFKWTSYNMLYPNIAENVHAPKIDNELHRKDYLRPRDVMQVESSILDHASKKIEEATSYSKDTKGRLERATEQGKRLYAMYLLAVTSGLRTIEISRANIEDLEVVGGIAYLYIQGKGHTEKDRKKALATEVYEALQDYLATRSDKKPTSPLFTSTGNRSKGKRILPGTISKMLKQALIQGGYNSDRLTAHSLRHTTGHAVMKTSENNIYITQHYLRHASPVTTETYTHEDMIEQEVETAQEVYSYLHQS